MAGDDGHVKGNFFELGPVALTAKPSLVRRPANETWASYVPVLFVDSPLGTGWSWANPGSFAVSQVQVAEDLVFFLQQVAGRLPVVHRRLVLAGESYGGHFVPALGQMLLTSKCPFQLEAIAVGDGLTDPATQVLTKPGEAFAFGLLDEAQLAKAQELATAAHDAAQAKLWGKAVDLRQAMEDFVKNVSAINPYDVRTTEQYDWMELRMHEFFDMNETKDLLHIPRGRRFGTTSAEVKLNLREDIMQSQKPAVEDLLKAGIRVLLYQGQFDWKDGVVSNAAWIRSLNWTGTASFLQANRTIWRRAADGQIAGYWRGFQNLEQVVVLGAGHLVPMNQPLSAVDMLLRFLHYPRPGPRKVQDTEAIQI
ncbi:SCPL50 [Symbiodinium natans]|uniref:Carboxypeptidase n=1 Tax=Symbiodinium natans TaxID=878477 RepID=A0A812T0L3_9DINO|nr:SCPL50 [Symbiodinium natans]